MHCALQYVELACAELSAALGANAKIPHEFTLAAYALCSVAVRFYSAGHPNLHPVCMAAGIALAEVKENPRRLPLQKVDYLVISKADSMYLNLLDKVMVHKNPEELLPDDYDWGKR